MPSLTNISLPDQWRARARRLDNYARGLRREGDTLEAREAEAAAVGYRVAADELEAKEAREQERRDSLTGGSVPVWNDETGTVDVRLLCGVAGVAVLALVVWFAWPYIVGAGVTVAGYRIATRGTRRRRPRSSWSSLGRTAAMMYAAYNSRWLKGPLVKASIPAKAGREHAPCGECGQTDRVPF